MWPLVKKDLRLLARDRRALIILLLMPLIFILVLGISLGEGFGQKPEEKLKVSVLILDEGPTRFVERKFPPESWAEQVLRDLEQIAYIKVELIGIPDPGESPEEAKKRREQARQEAQELVRTGERAAVLVLGPNFSKRVERCSFLAGGWHETFALGSCFQLAFASSVAPPGDPVLLALQAGFDESQTVLPLYALDGLNPFYRDGVNFKVLDVEVLRDPTQQTASAIIDQVAQGALVRVIMPWMIGRAFEMIADPQFLGILAQEEKLPGTVRFFLTSPLIPAKEKRALSVGLQNAIQNIFPKYNLTAKTWAALTREDEHTGGKGRSRYEKEGGGWLKRGTLRYQLLVPSYLVMFAFFLVLTVGWLFSAERQQGTLKRLCLAPLSRGQILLGKLLPCLALSLFQGLVLLLAGRVIFGMDWGPEPHWLALLVFSTSLAAMGLALLIASVARTETQVAIYGTLTVLVLSGLSGALMGDRSLMPEQMQRISRVTPHAWALDAYRQLLPPPGVTWEPNLALVAQACGVLAMFGVVFLFLAWCLMRLES